MKININIIAVSFNVFIPEKWMNFLFKLYGKCCKNENSSSLADMLNCTTPSLTVTEEG